MLQAPTTEPAPAKPAKPKKWRPRGSQLGHYMSCMYRAAFDRALYEHALNLSETQLAAIKAAQKSSPYADLGTCAHWTMQAGMGCIFTDRRGRPTDPILAKYTQDQLINASELFRRETRRTLEAIEATAALGRANMPAAPDGKPWFAEVSVNHPWFTGHIDFISQDYTHIVDLKTTSKPPLYDAIKPAHLVQVLAYAAGVDASQEKQTVEKVTVLYVDSLRADWAMPIVVDLTQPDMQDYKNQVLSLAKTLCGAQLYKVAVPQLGHACEEWCPYTTLCRDRYKSPRGDVRRVPAAPTMKQGPLL